MQKVKTKLWRNVQEKRVFKKRLKRLAACEYFGRMEKRPRWYDLAKMHWYQAYRTTATVCSCSMCSGDKYRRVEFKHATERIVGEEIEADGTAADALGAAERHGTATADGDGGYQCSLYMCRGDRRYFQNFRR